MSNSENSKQVIVARYYDSIRAHLAVNALQNSGIEAFLQNEFMSDMMPFGDGGYIIRVFDSDVVKAKHELNKLQAQIHETPIEDEKKVATASIFKDNPYLLYVLIFLLISFLILSFLFRGRVL